MISDGPGGGVYGLGACFQANVDSRNVLGAQDTTRFADPYTVLAKRECSACFLSSCSPLLPSCFMFVMTMSVCFIG